MQTYSFCSQLCIYAKFEGCDCEQYEQAVTLWSTLNRLRIYIRKQVIDKLRPKIFGANELCIYVKLFSMNTLHKGKAAIAKLAVNPLKAWARSRSLQTLHKCKVFKGRSFAFMQRLR
jgi:hypothetical protein